MAARIQYTANHGTEAWTETEPTILQEDWSIKKPRNSKLLPTTKSGDSSARLSPMTFSICLLPSCHCLAFRWTMLYHSDIIHRNDVNFMAVRSGMNCINQFSHSCTVLCLRTKE